MRARLAHFGEGNSVLSANYSRFLVDVARTRLMPRYFRKEDKEASYLDV